MIADPNRKDRLRPFELLGLSAVIGAFVGLVILVTTREWWLTFVSLGVAFILTLVTIALLELSTKPDAAEQSDLEEQNRGH